MVNVFNLAEGKYVAEYSCEPRNAVIAAHAQLICKDWSTWDYEKRYGHLVIEGNKTISCGDFSAKKTN